MYGMNSNNSWYYRHASKIVIVLALTLIALVMWQITAHAHHGGGSGENGRQTIVGTAGPDKLVGGHGPDTLRGLAGNDRLWGGRGPDILNGGPGYDVCHTLGRGDNDTLISCEKVVS